MKALELIDREIAALELQLEDGPLSRREVVSILYEAQHGDEDYQAENKDEIAAAEEFMKRESAIRAKITILGIVRELLSKAEPFGGLGGSIGEVSGLLAEASEELSDDIIKPAMEALNALLPVSGKALADIVVGLEPAVIELVKFAIGEYVKIQEKLYDAKDSLYRVRAFDRRMLFEAYMDKNYGGFTREEAMALVLADANASSVVTKALSGAAKSGISDAGSKRPKQRG